MADEFKVTDKRGQVNVENTNNENSEPQTPDSNHSDIGFTNLIVSLGTSAMIHMGIIDDPHTKSKSKNLEMARQEIDLIMMLEEKTKGNLNDIEKKTTEQILYELRLRFVEASKS